ncbi:UDP-glucuronosyltransferase 1-1 [Heterocephalus glaber]|uniref:glucuronosyltransferase n=1 Tax=Heterocephalus glaber TaxID=10181 RepID=G5B0W1_HETGA|nr:UDP-glucuronosyltransferase 1-1 [Heterocephalus glaber]EHB02922.1 UDP-glucuronosyltransferase 1-1 [Heterocephalus glaber]
MAMASLRPLLLVLGLLLCVLGPSVSHAGKLLVVPADGSHWLSMLGVIPQLQQNGHEIVVMAPEALLYIKEGSSYTLKTYPVPFQSEDVEASFVELGHDTFGNYPFLQRMIKIYKKVKRDSAMIFSGCSHLMHNKELMASLVESSFDVVLTDPFFPCGAIVAQYLALPAVFFLNALPCGLHFEATQCPNPLSYVPRSMSLNPDRMSFPQRVKNVLIALTEKVMCNMVYSPYSLLASEVLQRDVTIQDLLASASIWLLRTDFVNEYPRPTMPNMAFIGGINCLAKNLLSQVCIRVDFLHACTLGSSLDEGAF